MRDAVRTLHQLTQRQDTQPDDDLLTGRHAGDEPLQTVVVADDRYHGVGKLGVTGNVQRRAAVKDGQRLTEDTQVKGQLDTVNSSVTEHT